MRDGEMDSIDRWLQNTKKATLNFLAEVIRQASEIILIYSTLYLCSTVNEDGPELPCMTRITDKTCNTEHLNSNKNSNNNSNNNDNKAVITIKH